MSLILNINRVPTYSFTYDERYKLPIYIYEYKSYFFLQQYCRLIFS